MNRSPLGRLVAAAALVAAATSVLGPTAPASAEPCASGAGVTVVVDPGALGGALTSVCDSGSGQAASARYADAGIEITYVQRLPGFVCRVDGVPAADPCINTPPADAYWGLWWTDGESGTWTYSSIGVTGLKVPEGGAVALAWQQGSTRRVPGTAAPVRAVPPSPSKTPTKASPKTPTPKSSPVSSSATPASPPPSSTAPATPPPSSTAPATPSATASATSSGAPSSSPGRTPRTTPRTSRTSAAGATDTPTPVPEQPDATADPADDAARVPTWLTLTTLSLLLVAIGISTVAARRRTRR